MSFDEYVQRRKDLPCEMRIEDDCKDECRWEDDVCKNNPLLDGFVLIDKICNTLDRKMIERDIEKIRPKIEVSDICGKDTKELFVQMVKSKTPWKVIGLNKNNYESLMDMIVKSVNNDINLVYKEIKEFLEETLPVIPKRSSSPKKGSSMGKSLTTIILALMASGVMGTTQTMTMTAEPSMGSMFIDSISDDIYKGITPYRREARTEMEAVDLMSSFESIFKIKEFTVKDFDVNQTNIMGYEKIDSLEWKNYAESLIKDAKDVFDTTEFAGIKQLNNTLYGVQKFTKVLTTYSVSDLASKGFRPGTLNKVLEEITKEKFELGQYYSPEVVALRNSYGLFIIKNFEEQVANRLIISSFSNLYPADVIIEPSAPTDIYDLNKTLNDNIKLVSNDFRDLCLSVVDNEFPYLKSIESISKVWGTGLPYNFPMNCSRAVSLSDQHIIDSAKTYQNKANTLADWTQLSGIRIYEAFIRTYRKASDFFGASSYKMMSEFNNFSIPPKELNQSMGILQENIVELPDDVYKQFKTDSLEQYKKVLSVIKIYEKEYNYNLNGGGGRGTDRRERLELIKVGEEVSKFFKGHYDRFKMSPLGIIEQAMFDWIGLGITSLFMILLLVGWEKLKMTQVNLMIAYIIFGSMIISGSYRGVKEYARDTSINIRNPFENWVGPGSFELISRQDLPESVWNSFLVWFLTTAGASAIGYYWFRKDFKSEKEKAETVKKLSEKDKKLSELYESARKRFMKPTSGDDIDKTWVENTQEITDLRDFLKRNNQTGSVNDLQEKYLQLKE